MNYKIVFPTGYLNVGEDVLNNNVDVNIIFDTGHIYFGILITILNIQHIMMQNNDQIYFWIEDLFIVKDLSKETIKDSIDRVIKEDVFFKIFTKIGVLGEADFEGVTFLSLPNMNNRAEDIYLSLGNE